VYQIVGVPENR